MFIQTIINETVLAISRDKRSDIMEVADWEIYDFDDPTKYELAEYKVYLLGQLAKVETIILDRIQSN